ncbi:MAG: right-handed parallel beta-helix repeat-containing protein [Candidatus Poribacteria bacterium]|nr:right-handed parallel beta-helix repeat-containing protein [Candidatus Poribacteria bacterium]
MQHSLSITVGRQDAQINGSDDRALQAGVDYLAALGGGTLKILPGEYHLNNAIYLRSQIRIEGSGAETILIKNPSVRTNLAVDSDWYDADVTLADRDGFAVGYGVCLKARNPHHGARDIIKRTIVGCDGDHFWLDRPLDNNFWADHEAQISTLFPILTGEHIHDVEIHNLVLDGNRPNNEHLDGNYAGCIFLQNCERIGIDNVEARNYNGDGISWQICHDVTVTNCRSLNNADLGLHPGSGSQRPTMRDNHLEGNRLGLFFCWGVKHGVAENNRMLNNRDFGISVGHRDTDNIIRSNRIEGSGKVGVLFRDEPNEGRCPHRNLVENNDIVNSGSDGKGTGIDIQGQTRSITIRRNRITETRGAAEYVGVRIGHKTADVVLEENGFSGLALDVEDLRSRQT